MSLHDTITNAVDRCHCATYMIYIKDQMFKVTCFWKKAIGYNIHMAIYTVQTEPGKLPLEDFALFHKIKSSSMADPFMARMLLIDTVAEMFELWQQTDRVIYSEPPIFPQVENAFINLFTHLK